MSEVAEQGRPDAPRLGWRTVAVVLAFYAATVVVGSKQRGEWDPTTQFPSFIADALQHTWIMKWYKTCLFEWRSPLICPEIEYPVGAPLGDFSPMHLQALLYLPISLVVHNDILVYNILWLIGFLFTGMGVFALAWHVTRDRWCAAFAGLAAMISGPMMARACGHLELMYVGGFPLFLIGWQKFIDQPTRKRMFAAAGLCLLVTLSAAYFLVYSVVPAVLYVLWAWRAAWRRGERGWLRARVRPLIGFVAVMLPFLLVLFAGHIWASVHGFSSGRSDREFESYATPFWGYLFPLTGYRFERFFPMNPYRDPKVPGSLDAINAYLGLTTLALVAYAAIRRVKFAKASFWWTLLVVLVLLGLGASWTIGGVKVPLPSSWLRKTFFAFRLIREVDRYNLFAMVAATLVAAVALRDLVGRLGRPALRAAAVAGVMAFTVADLSQPFWGMTPPSMPPCYEAILRVDPEASFVEVNGADLNAATGYWQSVHRGRSTAAFSGLVNLKFLNLITLDSPFSFNNVEDPHYLDGVEDGSFDFLSRARFTDYAWLFLKTHDLRYVVVHKGGSDGQWNPPSLPRIDALLAEARVYQDDRTAVYAASRIPPPKNPVLLILRGWNSAWYGELRRVAGRSARMIAYNPDPDRPLTFRVTARAFDRARTVRLLDAEGAELARWRVRGDAPAEYRTPPLHLPAGLVRLTLESDGDARLAARVDDLDPGPFSLRVTGLGLEPASEAVATTAGGEDRSH
jgi:hypothetical protein